MEFQLFIEIWNMITIAWINSVKNKEKNLRKFFHLLLTLVWKLCITLHWLYFCNCYVVISFDKIFLGFLGQIFIVPKEIPFKMFIFFYLHVYFKKF